MIVREPVFIDETTLNLCDRMKRWVEWANQAKESDYNHSQLMRVRVIVNEISLRCIICISPDAVHGLSRRRDGFGSV